MWSLVLLIPDPTHRGSSSIWGEIPLWGQSGSQPVWNSTPDSSPTPRFREPTGGPGFSSGEFGSGSTNRLPGAPPPATEGRVTPYGKTGELGDMVAPWELGNPILRTTNQDDQSTETTRVQKWQNRLGTVVAGRRACSTFDYLLRASGLHLIEKPDPCANLKCGSSFSSRSC